MKPSVCESKCTNVGKQLAQQILGPYLYSLLERLHLCVGALDGRPHVGVVGGEEGGSLL